MVKDGSLPLGGGMARNAILGETGCGMIGAARRLIVLQMAGNARRVESREDAVCVALRATRGAVLAG